MLSTNSAPAAKRADSIGDRMREAHEGKAPDPIDVHVGAVIRRIRRGLGISQETLADKLGLTFQQVQKYEKGANRISASKLARVAIALRTPVGYFFEGAPVHGLGTGETAPTSDDKAVRAFAESAEGRAMILDLAALPGSALRNIAETASLLADARRASVDNGEG